MNKWYWRELTGSNNQPSTGALVLISLPIIALLLVLFIGIGAREYRQWKEDTRITKHREKARAEMEKREKHAIYSWRNSRNNGEYCPIDIDDEYECNRERLWSSIFLSDDDSEAPVKYAACTCLMDYQEEI